MASLAIASANGLLMKGGKEATHTNNLLMSIVKEGLGAYGCADSISLVSTREDIADLLKMDQVTGGRPNYNGCGLGLVDYDFGQLGVWLNWLCS